MGLIKNAINFGNGFNIGAVAPIDSRMRVEKVSDLTSVWTAEIPAYKGMIVTVMETSEVYVLKDAKNYTNIDSWIKLGSADAATAGSADALKQAKAYTDQLANGAVQTNTNAIATLNGNATTEGSVAYAVAAEKTRAMAAEKANADAIAAETAAREDAIRALDANVTSTGGTHVTVNVIEDNGVITAVNVTESDIASATGLTSEISAREEADQAINAKIGEVETSKTVVGMINAEAERATAAEAGLVGRVAVNETAIAILNGDSGTTGSVANAVAAETTRAQGVESGLNSRLATVEGDYLKSADKTELSSAISTEKSRAMAAEKANADAIAAETAAREDAITAETAARKAAIIAETAAREDAIRALDANVTSTGGTHVTVNVIEDNGVITAVNVTESDIASAAVLKEVKKDVDNFFKDASFSENAKDTLKELQEYINTDAAGALTMETAIANNQKAIKDEVARANAAEQVNATAIADEKSRAESKESELATSIATEKSRAEGEELKLNNAITAETQNRTNAINALNATAGTRAVSEGTHVAVEVVETAGKLTSLVVTEKDIASAGELKALKDSVGNGFSSDKTVAKAIADNTKAINDEKKSREDADKAINDKIGTVETDKTVVEMIADAKAAAIAASTVVTENSEFITVTKSGEAGKTQTYTITTQDIASATATSAAIAAETTAREKAMTAETATRVAAEAQVLADAKTYTNTEVKKEADRAKGIEDGLNSRLTTVERDYVKSVEAAKGSMITVSETEQKVTLSLQWGTF